jgi:hypothetical protein
VLPGSAPLGAGPRSDMQKANTPWAVLSPRYLRRQPGRAPPGTGMRETVLWHPVPSYDPGWNSARTALGAVRPGNQPIHPRVDTISKHYRSTCRCAAWAAAHPPHVKYTERRVHRRRPHKEVDHGTTEAL